MVVYQYQTSIHPYDAMSNNVFEIDKLLLENKVKTQIIADDFSKSFEGKIKNWKKVKINKEDLLIAHFGIGKEFFDKIHTFPCKKIMIYHNITPPHFASNMLARTEAKKGLDQLASMANIFDECIAVSEYNAKDLRKNNYKNIHVVPFLRDFSYLETEKENKSLAKILNDQNAIIFIGRVSPQKKQQDIVKAFYFYRKYCDSNAKLYIIGGYDKLERAYIDLISTVTNLNLLNDVFITGKISDQDLITYLKNSKLMLSMSEHEGFYVPAAEAMYFGLPILAYAHGGAIADTIGTGGILFNQKDFLNVGLLMEYIIHNKEINQQIKINQKNEIAKYDAKIVKEQLLNIFSKHI